MFDEDDGLPEHLVDDEIKSAIAIVEQSENITSRHYQYQPSVGLLIKLVKGLRRLMKRGKINQQSDDGARILWKLYRYYSVDSPTFDVEFWTDSQLFATGNNFICVCREISPTLLRNLDRHYLLPPQNDEDIIHLDDAFLERVVSYHKSLERPPNTFEDVHDDLDYLRRMADLPRETCPSCGCQRQLYCGECGGKRMSGGMHLLPDPIQLPFDVLLILHWRESLHKCTGIHAAVLAEKGSVSFVRWHKENKEEWKKIVLSLDSKSDLLLYPSDDAVRADRYNWALPLDCISETKGSEGVNGLASAMSTLNMSLESPKQLSTRTRRRIVLLEGPWEGAKTLARQLLELREEMGLPPLTYLTLPDGITGRYWRLQHVGSSAVSTIEAIAHVAWSAVYTCARDYHGTYPATKTDDILGVETECAVDEEAARTADACRNALLLLFNLQRFRVLESLKTGKRVPVAIATSHSGGFETFWDGYMRRHNVASYLANFASS